MLVCIQNPMKFSSSQRQGRDPINLVPVTGPVAILDTTKINAYLLTVRACVCVCVCVCKQVLFFRRPHFIQLLHIYEYLLYVKHCAGHWVYKDNKDTILAQGVHNLAERWMTYNNIKTWGTVGNVESVSNEQGRAHLQNIHILVESHE